MLYEDELHTLQFATPFTFVPFVDRSCAGTQSAQAELKSLEEQGIVAQRIRRFSADQGKVRNQACTQITSETISDVL